MNLVARATRIYVGKLQVAPLTPAPDTNNRGLHIPRHLLMRAEAHASTSALPASRSILSPATPTGDRGLVHPVAGLTPEAWRRARAR